MRRGGDRARVSLRLASLHATSLTLLPDPAYLDHTGDGAVLLARQRQSVVSFLSEVIAYDLALCTLRTPHVSACALCVCAGSRRTAPLVAGI